MLHSTTFEVTSAQNISQKPSYHLIIRIIQSILRCWYCLCHKRDSIFDQRSLERLFVRCSLRDLGPTYQRTSSRERCTTQHSVAAHDHQNVHMTTYHRYHQEPASQTCQCYESCCCLSRERRTGPAWGRTSIQIVTIFIDVSVEHNKRSDISLHLKPHCSAFRLELCFQFRVARRRRKFEPTLLQPWPPFNNLCASSVNLSANDLTRRRP